MKGLFMETTKLAQMEKVDLKEPGRPREISTQITIFNNQLERMDKILGELEIKLSPILAPSKPSNPKPQGETAVFTDIGKLLQSYNNRFNMFIDMVHDFINRIEI